MRAAELQRAAPDLTDLSDDERDAVDHLTRRIVAKLLHAPLKNTRRLGASNQGYIYLDTVRELFELDDDRSS